MSSENWTDDLKINRLKLDIECERQAELYGHYADLLADARTDRDHLRTALKEEMARTSLHYRAQPPDGIKVTDKTIDALIEIDEDVRKLKTELEDIEARFNALDAAVSAFDHRRSMLNNLTDLHTTGYYSATGMGPIEETGRQARKELNERRKAKRSSDG